MLFDLILTLTCSWLCVTCISCYYRCILCTYTFFYRLQPYRLSNLYFLRSCLHKRSKSTYNPASKNVFIRKTKYALLLILQLSAPSDFWYGNFERRWQHCKSWSLVFLALWKFLAVVFVSYELDRWREQKLWTITRRHLWKQYLWRASWPNIYFIYTLVISIGCHIFYAF